MKTSYSGYDALAHAWAYGDNNFEGHTPGRRMFAYGNRIFSYGSHFMIAQKVQTKSGTVVIFNSNTYSNTTCTHQACVRAAIRDRQIIEVPGAELNHENNVKYFTQEIKTALEKRAKARKYAESYLIQAIVAQEKAKLYVETFKIRLDKASKALFFNPFSDSDTLEKAQEIFTAQAKARDLKIKREKAEQIKKEKDRLQAWINGATGSFYGRYTDKAYLRYNKELDIIETSQSAHVSVRAARLFWDMVKSGRPVHGFRFDDRYPIVSLNGELIVGCHHIPRTEIDRMAVVLGW